MIKTKKQMFIVIGAFALILLLGTASYAFFNYTRTGETNTVGIGRIYFNTDQGNDTLTLSNIFPMTSSQATTANLDSVAVHIQGDTTYNDGEEFEITLVNVTNTVNGKTIPINYTATYVASENKEIGTSSDSYFTSRGSSSNVYQFTSTGEVSEGKQVLVGFIPKDGEVDGTLTIKAYIDSSKVVISDTLQDGAIEVTGYNNGYPNPGEGVTVLTTEEWNALEGAGTLKFSVRGIANEGTWVEDPTIATNLISRVQGLETTPYGKVYSGANAANYVTFNGESWRIIGVYGDKLKIVKAEPLEDTQKYNNSTSDGNTWNGSLLETYLNTTYYSNLSQTAQEMIAEGSWDVGECEYEISASAAYTCAHETTLTGPDANSNRVKVGLIATYEYLYAAENTCWTKIGSAYSAGSNTCAAKDWLYGALTYNGSSSAWTLSPLSDDASRALLVLNDGSVYSSSVRYARAASPVVYLNPNVKITGGDGTTPQTAYTLSYTAS